jgi:hypothetical protein
MNPIRHRHAIAFNTNLIVNRWTLRSSPNHLASRDQNQPQDLVGNTPTPSTRRWNRNFAAQNSPRMLPERVTGEYFPQRPSLRMPL